MTVIGELTAGTAPAKAPDAACRTCGAVMPLTPGGYCFNPNECDRRRVARVSKTQHLRKPCIVRLFERGGTYYLREFGPKIAPAPLVMPPGFTAKDYEANPNHVYYEGVMERSAATPFSVAKALHLARRFAGTAINA